MLPLTILAYFSTDTYIFLLGVLKGAALLSDSVCVCSPTTHSMWTLSGCLMLGIVGSWILAIWWVSSGRKPSVVWACCSLMTSKQGWNVSVCVYLPLGWLLSWNYCLVRFFYWVSVLVFIDLKEFFLCILNTYINGRCFLHSCVCLPFSKWCL